MIVSDSESEGKCTTQHSIKACDHCGKISPSLLRCSQCKSAWYCDATCQSMAWKPSGDGKEGHRKICRRVRKKLASAANATLSPKTTSATQAKISTSPSMAPESRGGDAKGALVELMEHVNTMDKNEAYKQMCLAQDEIQRLKSEIQDISQEPKEDIPKLLTPILTETISEAKIESVGKTEAPGRLTNVRDKSSSKVIRNPKKGDLTTISHPVEKKGNSENSMFVSGSWLDQGGKCSVEYLPNVKCYSFTLAATAGDSLDIPQLKESLHVTIAPVHDINHSQFPSVSYFEARLYQLKGTVSSPSSAVDRGQNMDLIFSACLLTNSATKPIARISLDSNSISLRVQLHHEVATMAMDGIDLMDNLLGVEGSCFSSITTNALDLNYLRCRKCQNPLFDSFGSSNAQNRKDHSAVIKSVFPLPSGNWDDISDYLICYEGQAAVDFNSSSTNAIPNAVLEDDTILVLHQHDLAHDSVRTTRRFKGYGEHSSAHLNNTGRDISAHQDWKEKSAVKGERSKPVTCANCCSTLGFVSDHNSDTFWLYKHLLDCGNPQSITGASLFSKYTCGSFLAKEMVRYAESEAVYTFIVGISDENDWTKIHKNDACILLRILSWDTSMAIAGGRSENSLEDSQINFQKMVKVIFEVASDKKELTAANDGPLEWTWRETDFCCPPQTSRAEPDDMGLTLDENSSAALHTKASSTRIFFSKREWSELRDTLIGGVQYFSEAMKDAVVMAKLGMPSTDQEQTATLSFLPFT